MSDIETISKFEFSNGQNRILNFILNILILKIQICFGFRASCFEF
jgi:hypothetical protein